MLVDCCVLLFGIYDYFFIGWWIGVCFSEVDFLFVWVCWIGDCCRLGVGVGKEWGIGLSYDCFV